MQGLQTRMNVGLTADEAFMKIDVMNSSRIGDSEMVEEPPARVSGMCWLEKKSRFPGLQPLPNSNCETDPLVWIGSKEGGLYLVNNSGYELTNVKYGSTGILQFDEDDYRASEPRELNCIGDISAGEGALLETIDEIADSDWLISYHFEFYCAPKGLIGLSTPFKKSGVKNQILMKQNWVPAKEVRSVIREEGSRIE